MQSVTIENNRSDAIIAICKLKSKFKVIDEAYLNNLRAMKVNIPGPSRVNVPEPFRQNERVSSSFGASKSPYGASATSRSPYSATSRASSTSR